MSENGFEQTLVIGAAMPAAEWQMHADKHALDELFSLARQYRSSKAYRGLIDFIARFRFYSPFNAMLVHIQMPGATFVAPANRWLKKYSRSINSDARPLVILQPMGPVMFVFDVSDTEQLVETNQQKSLFKEDVMNPSRGFLPPEVEKPYEIESGEIGRELKLSIENAKRDGIRIVMRKEGSQSAGSIRRVTGKGVSPLQFYFGKDRRGNDKIVFVPNRFDLLVNRSLGREARYATIVHELAHLYCGHLGTPNNKWWPDRRGLPYVRREFEAESVSYMTCKRLGIESPSEKYLADFLKNNEEVSEISLECVMKATGLIERMGRNLLKPRKDKG